MKPIDLMELRSRIESLKRNRDDSGNLWIGIGGFGVLVAILGLDGHGSSAGFGLAVSAALFLYGFHANDKAKKADEEIKRLEKQLDRAEKAEQEWERRRIEREIDLDFDDDDD